MQHTLVIFDTEFTAWPGSQDRGWSESWEFRELIQIAAVKLSVSENGVEILSSFNELVRPQRNPELSGYITELTGISQIMVDEMGVDFASALSQFHDFCEKGKLACFAWGNDPVILTENCQLNELSMPGFASGFYNLKQLALALNLDGAALSSGELATHFGLSLSGHQHNALYDVRSLAGALKVWTQSGQLSPDILFRPIS